MFTSEKSYSTSLFRSVPLFTTKPPKFTDQYYEISFSELKIKHFLISCRITQTYDTGCCVYFYLAFNSADQEDPVHVFEELESLAREEILKCGGSVSHHHGIGKIRSKFYTSQVSEYGANLYRVVKRYVDPQNIFGIGNILSRL